MPAAGPAIYSQNNRCDALMKLNLLLVGAIALGGLGVALVAQGALGLARQQELRWSPAHPVDKSLVGFCPIGEPRASAWPAWLDPGVPAFPLAAWLVFVLLALAIHARLSDRADRKRDGAEASHALRASAKTSPPNS